MICMSAQEVRTVKKRTVNEGEKVERCGAFRFNFVKR